MGVVYHANYLVWCELGRTDLIRALGRPYAEIEGGGVALAVVEAALRFLRPARYDDVVRIVTSVGDMRSRVVTFAYELLRGDEVLCTASTTLVGMTRDGRSAVVPAELRHALEAFRAA